MREFCTAEGNYKKDYAKIAEQIDALLEIIDFGSPVAVHFVKEFEKLNCEAFFTYEMKKPYYFSNFNIEKRLKNIKIGTNFYLKYYRVDIEEGISVATKIIYYIINIL